MKQTSKTQTKNNKKNETATATAKHTKISTIQMAQKEPS